MDSRQYQRTFLRNVIVRADFAAPLVGSGGVWPDGVTKTVLQQFPIEEEHRSVQMSTQSVVEGVLSQPELANETEVHYYSLNRTNHLGLGRGFLFVETSKYAGFSALRGLFEPVVQELFSMAPSLAIRRLGLRYINVVAQSGRRPLDWSGLINPKLTSMLGFLKDTGALIRGMGNMEFGIDETSLRLQYGVFNPDYPAAVKRKEFVLDIDASSPGLTSFEQLVSQLVVLHEHVEIVFEGAIGEKLRKAMMLP